MPTWFVDDPNTFTPPAGRASAHLTILSEVVSARDLVEMLGVPPDNAWNKGERKHAPGRFSGISIASRLAESAAPADHLTDLLLRIEPIAATVRSLNDDDRIASVRVWLVHHLPNWNPGFSISADQLRRLDQIGVGLEIDAYVVEPDAARRVTLADT